MILAQLMQLDHPDGAVRFSTLPFDWVDAGAVTWIGGAHVISLGARVAETGSGGGTLTVQWNGYDAALIATALEPQMLRLPFSIRTVEIDDSANPPAQSGAAFDLWSGICETPDIVADPERGAITLTVQSALLELNRVRRTLLDPATQKAIDPDDTGADWVAKLADHAPHINDP